MHWYRAKRLRIMAVLGAALVTALAATACGGDSAPTPTPAALVELPPPEAFGALPAPEGARIVPQTTEFPMPSANPPPTDYSQVGPAYSEAHDALLAKGREISALLIAGDAAAVRERFNSRLRGGMTEERILDRLKQISTNRVHFEVVGIGGTFDGHVDGDQISGEYIDETLAASFALKATELTGPGPLEGRWEGAIVLGEDSAVAVVVEFESTDGRLAAILALPEQGQTGVPASSISFDATRPIGERLVDLGVGALYGADHRWGDQRLSIWLTFDSSGSIIGLDTVSRRPLPPHPAAEYESPTQWRLPVDGIWWVNYGGPTYLQNLHVGIPAKRYAYDLAIWKDGGFVHGSGSSNEDFWGFGQAVVAPADGTVVAVLDGVEDNKPGQVDQQGHPAGNHIIIGTAADEYVVLAHLQQGSIRVEQGDTVKAGDLLALTGNSGRSVVPHLHFYVQDQPDIASPIALGVPVLFSSYYADGKLVASGAPVQGQLIQHAEE